MNLIRRLINFRWGRCSVEEQEISDLKKQIDNLRAINQISETARFYYKRDLEEVEDAYSKLCIELKEQKAIVDYTLLEKENLQKEFDEYKSIYTHTLEDSLSGKKLADMSHLELSFNYLKSNYETLKNEVEQYKSCNPNNQKIFDMIEEARLQAEKHDRIAVSAKIVEEAALKDNENLKEQIVSLKTQMTDHDCELFLKGVRDFGRSIEVVPNKKKKRKKKKSVRKVNDDIVVIPVSEPEA